MKRQPFPKAYIGDCAENSAVFSESVRPRDATGVTATCRKIEEELKKSQRQLAEAQRIAHIGSWEWNIEENSMTWSDEMFRIFGLEPRPLFPTFEEVLAYIHEEDRAVVKESFSRALENLESFSYEVRVCRPDGTVRVVHSQGDVIANDAGVPLRLISTEKDITERISADAVRKRLEEQLVQSQKMEAMGRLAGGIAHDFNNILTAILGYAELLQVKLNPDDPLSSMVGQIHFSASKAAKLTKGLLTFSRKQVIIPKPVNMHESIRSVAALLTRLIGEDIEMIINLSDKRSVVMADPGQMEQILMNLATNARDAMPQGGRITISTDVCIVDTAFVASRGWGRPGTYLLLEVTDTGHGMDANIQEKIFEPFFTTREVGKGTGLGLSIVYGIIQQHNGFIRVASEPMRGTTFQLYLPLLELDDVREAQPQKEKPKKGVETILLAEDDATLRQLAVTILQEYGYTVIQAENGEEAIDVFSRHQKAISLVILDVIMPKMNGREAYEEIRRKYPCMKFLFLSGYTSDILEHKGVLEADFHFLPKPLSAQVLLHTIRTILDS